MLTGHYGVAFALRAKDRSASLGAYFIAVQLLDVLWTFFAAVGVEHLRIVPGFTESNPLDLYDMPYSHSLLAAFFWAIVAFGLRLLWSGSRGTIRASVVTASAVGLGLAVFSHYLLDLPMHVHDLALYPGQNAPKLGWGLWNHRWLSIALEMILFVAGYGCFVAKTGIRLPRFSGFLLLMTFGAYFGPPPPGSGILALVGLTYYLGVAAMAHRLDPQARRSPGA
jgi:hypothetical protein